jgi:hypothetical protein
VTVARTEPRIDLERLAVSQPTWGVGLDDTGLTHAGPLDRMRGAGVGLSSTVTLLPADWSPGLGRARERRNVRESAAAFEVTYHDFEGAAGLWHGGGHNWIVWSPEPIPRRLAISGTADAARDWVHVRFLLRHLNTALLIGHARREPIHAVVGAIADRLGGGGLLIQGRSGAGKTDFWQMLREAGLVVGMPEDDCAMIGPDWDAACLLPEPDRLLAAERIPIRAIVRLAEGGRDTGSIDGSSFLADASTTGVSWPATWLPAGDLRPRPTRLPPPTVPILRSGERPTDTGAIDAVVALIEAASADPKTSATPG